MGPVEEDDGPFAEDEEEGVEHLGDLGEHEPRHQAPAMQHLLTAGCLYILLSPVVGQGAETKCLSTACLPGVVTIKMPESGSRQPR